MAVKTDGTVYINTEIDSNGFNSGVKSMQSGIGNLSNSLKKLGVVIGSVFAIRELVQFGKEAVDLGSDLQEVQNVVDVTFTKMSDKVDEFARNAAKSAGLSETMAKRYVGTFGAMAKSFGFVEEDALKMSTSLTQLSGDVASFYNLTQDEAYTKLKSVFTGETESLKDLGVVMTQTALDQFALQKGLGKTTKQMSEQEKVALRYSFVMEQLSGASGDFLRTSDGWANQTRILKLNIESLKANVGQGLINLFTPLLQVLNALIERLVIASQKFKEFMAFLFGTPSTSGVTKELEETSSGYDDTADSIDGYSDATEDAVKSTKKMLSSFDELNLLSSDLNKSLNGFNDEIIQPPGSAGIDAVIDIENSDDIITRFWAKVKNVFEDMLNYDFTSIGEKLSGFGVWVFDSLSNALETVDWNGIGKKIGEFLNGIKWEEVLLSVGNFFVTLIDSAVDLWLGSFDKAPLGTLIISGLALAVKAGAAASLGAALATVLKSALLVAIVAAFGWNIGQYLYEQLTGEEIEMSFTEQMEAIGESFSDGTWKGAFELIGADLASAIKDGFADVWQSIDEVIIKPFAEAFDDIWQSFEEVILTPITEFFSDLYESVSNLFDSTGGRGTGGRGGGGSGGGHLGGRSAYGSFSNLSVPFLATGAVIPPNAPFMAMLGDQTNGRNLEAPEGLIRQIIREEVAQIGVNVTFDVQGDEAGIFNVTQRQAVLFTKQTGRPAYPTGG